jgi:conjugative relaxase-like TrwC/TraI family protein
MLNITAQKNAEAAKEYFSRSDYYASVDEQELVGQWGGRAAVLLGLFGKVDKASFDRLCDNQDPKTCEQLSKITRDGRRVGYDFTFSAPKSASVLQALTGDESIMQAWRDSVRETMDAIECEMQTRVRKNGQEADRTTGNFLWSEFVHLTSRPVNNIPCPQLHSHIFVQNLSFDSIEGQWKAGQFGRIKSEGYFWQATQQARFALKLEELGFATRPTKDAFEIAGVPDSIIPKFSLRTGVIERTAAKLGITDPKRKAGLAATTRDNKNDTIPYSELLETWNGWLTPDERVALLDVSDNAKPKTPTVENDRHAKFAIDHTFERTSIAQERRLLTVALKHGFGHVTPEGVREAVDDQGLLAREINGKVWVTTKQVLADERRMLAAANAGKGACLPLAGSEPICFHAKRLDRDQLKAVEHVLTSTDSVVLILGDAGTGKTTLAREAVTQLEDRGKRVVMLAPSIEASRGVLRKKEGFKNADTLARFLVDPKMQATGKDGVIWLDEAGLVSTQEMAKLFDLAGELNARVVAVGDHKQMASVSRGAAFRALQDIAQLPVAEISEIKRQTVWEYKDAVKSLAEGKTAEGFDKLDKLGWIKLLPVWDQYRPVAESYVSHLEKKQDCLIVVPTHAEAALVVAAVRTQLKAKELLGNDDQIVPRLVPLQWSEAERRDLNRYSGDECLRFHRNVGSFKAGQQVNAGDVMDQLAGINPKYFSVFAEQQIPVAVGELVRMGFTCDSKDGKHRLNNGSSYRVKSFTAKGDLVLHNGWVLDRNAGAVGHSYTSTAFVAQGRSADHVILVQSALSRPATSRQGFYVALSRGRKSAEVFCEDRRALREAVQRSDPRITATELLEAPKTPLWQRMQKKIERVEQATWWAVHKAAAEIQHHFERKEFHHER